MLVLCFIKIKNLFFKDYFYLSLTIIIFNLNILLASVIILPDFLLHWLKANTPYLERVANGTTFDELNSFDLFELKIGIPKIKEQQKIVNFLNFLDEKIQNNLKIKQILISSLFTLYKNWFRDNNQKNNSKQKSFKKVDLDTKVLKNLMIQHIMFLLL